MADELEDHARDLLRQARQLQRIAERMSGGGSRSSRPPRESREPRERSEERPRPRPGGREESGPRAERRPGDAPSWAPNKKRRKP